MHSRNLPYSVHDLLEVFEVGNLEHHVDAGLPVLAAGFHASDVGLGVADDRGDLFEHSPAVVAEKRELHGIRNRVAIFVSSPEDVNATVGLVQEIRYVRTIDRVHRNSLAAGDIADDGLAADRVTTACAIHKQITGAADYDGVAVSAKNASYYARESGRSVLFLGVRHRLSAGGSEFRQHLPGGILAIADACHQVVVTAESVFAGNALPVGVFNIFQRDSVFASFFFDQLLADFNSTLALVNIEPVLDLVARTRRLDDGQPVAAGLVSRLRDDFDDVTRMEFVTQRHHASVDLGPGATVSDLGVDRIGEVDRRRLARQHQHLAFGGKGVNLFRIEIDFQRGEKFVGIGNIALPLDDLPQPGEPLLVFGRDRAVLIFPMSRDPFFAHLVHFFRADLDLKSLARLGDHGSV